MSKLKRTDLRTINKVFNKDSMVKKVKNLKDVIGAQFVLLEPKQARALANGAMLHVKELNIVLEMIPLSKESRAIEASAAKQRDSAKRRMENRNKQGFYRQGRIRTLGRYRASP